MVFSAKKFRVRRLIGSIVALARESLFLHSAWSVNSIRTHSEEMIRELSPAESGVARRPRSARQAERRLETPLRGSQRKPYRDFRDPMSYCIFVRTLYTHGRTEYETQRTAPHRDATQCSATTRFAITSRQRQCVPSTATLASIPIAIQLNLIARFSSRVCISFCLHVLDR